MDPKALTQNDGFSGAGETKTIIKADPQQEQEVSRLTLLVKQRDNEIGILLNYLNKKKEQGPKADGDLKVSRSNNGNNFNESQNQDPNSTLASVTQHEEQKQQTLFQMMSGQKAQPEKSIKEKRIEFEFNQSSKQDSS